MARVGLDPVDAIVDRAAAASDVWARSALAADERDPAHVFGRIAGGDLAEGVEAIYEGYLVHHAPRGRGFRAPDREQGLLLGDYLYATGLVQVTAAGDVEAIAALSDLVTLAAAQRAEADRPADAELWLATARHLAGPRDDRLAVALDALRAGDRAPLAALVADDEAQEPLALHRRLMGDA
ncbi:MAG: hypothetical protein RL190_1521 [Actinomycetota bacterium]